MFLNISINTKDKWAVIVFILTTLILITAIFLMIIFINKIKKGDVFNNKLDLSFVNYYTEYDMTVISNKNINTYAVKEWHKEGNATKLEYLDYMKNKVSITLENNVCSIVNSGNTAKLIINNMIDNKNISSLSTFAYLYNMNCEECGCEKNKHIKENEVIVTISFKEDCKCNCGRITSELGVYAIKLILLNNVPQNYIIYNKNKKEYISIVYNVFETNTQI